MLKMISMAVMAGSIVAASTVPAMAEGYYDRQGNYHYDSATYDDGYYNSPYSNQRAAARRSAEDQRAYDAAEAQRQADADAYYNGQKNCKHAGSHGAVAGALLGGLLGQGVKGNTTGTVVGAGVGAVAGSAINKSNCGK